MGGTSQNNQIGEGLPKTTTWGRRLALLALITLLPAGLSFDDWARYKLRRGHLPGRAALRSERNNGLP